MRRLALAFGLTALLAGCGDYTLNPYAVDAPLRIPVLSLQTPASDGEAADASFSIKVSFEKVVVDDTWSLYYVSDATPAKGAAIGTNLPVTARSLVWDTSQMPAGTYYLYGELSSLDGVITASAPGSIVVDHPTVEGNHSPSVALATPNGGETYTEGDVVSVAWTGSDADGDTVTYKLETSADGGNTWTTLADALTASPYDWTVAAADGKSPSYKVRVTATDAKNATAVDQSDRVFQVH